MTIDFVALGTSYRAQADKALHRAIAFAVVLVLTHLLDIRPSEIDALGLKIAFKDPSVLYGAISLVFDYQFSRFLSLTETGETLFSLKISQRRIRAIMHNLRRFHVLDKRQNKKSLTPKSIKRGTWWNIFFSDLMLLPYRIIASLFITVAFIFMMHDIYTFAVFIWNTSATIAEIGNVLTGA